jgi:hypothetical protein
METVTRSIYYRKLVHGKKLVLIAGDVKQLLTVPYDP